MERIAILMVREICQPLLNSKLEINYFYKYLVPQKCFAQSTGAIEYTDCTSAEGYDHRPKECPGYVTKQSDG